MKKNTYLNIKISFILSFSITLFFNTNVMGQKYKFGYLDKKGNEVIPAIFDFCGKFSEGLAPVRINNDYGYIDKTGKIVIALQFLNTQEFKNGLGKIYETVGGPYRYIDKSGVISTNPDAELIYNATEGLYVFTGNENKKGYKNIKGEIVLPAIYKNAESFYYTGFATVYGDDYVKYYINKKGDKVDEKQLKENSIKLGEGIYFEEKEKKIYLVDTKLNKVYEIDSTIDHISYFKNGMCRFVKNGMAGFINKKGEIVIPAIYSNNYPFFENGVAIVVKDGDKFLINKKNEVLSKSTYWLDDGFHEGLWAIRITPEKYGFVDTLGNIVITTNYEGVGNFSEGFTTFMVSNNAYVPPNIPNSSISLQSVLDKLKKSVTDSGYQIIASGTTTLQGRNFNDKNQGVLQNIDHGYFYAFFVVTDKDVNGINLIMQNGKFYASGETTTNFNTEFFKETVAGSKYKSYISSFGYTKHEGGGGIYIIPKGESLENVSWFFARVVLKK